MRGKWLCPPLSSLCVLLTLLTLCVLLTLLTRAHTEWQVAVAVLGKRFE
jgi:hypothetical protein